MAIILHEKLYPAGEIGVWEIEDHTIQLFEQLELTDAEREEVSSMSERRKKEWISARWLIHKLSGRSKRLKCIKDAYGKPYLEDHSFQISISHSQDKVAVIASPFNVGIDIQERVEKMERLSIKFQHPTIECWAQSLLDKHILWGAKESMYKAWGKKGIDFKDQMQVKEGKWKSEIFYTEGRLNKGNTTMLFDIRCKQVKSYILVTAIEKTREIEDIK